MPVNQSLKLLHLHLLQEATVEYLHFAFQLHAGGFSSALLLLGRACFMQLFASHSINIGPFFFFSIAADSFVSVCVLVSCFHLNPRQYHSINIPLVLCILLTWHSPSICGAPSLWRFCYILLRFMIPAHWQRCYSVLFTLTCCASGWRSINSQMPMTWF